MHFCLNFIRTHHLGVFIRVEICDYNFNFPLSIGKIEFSPLCLKLYILFLFCYWLVLA